MNFETKLISNDFKFTFILFLYCLYFSFNRSSLELCSYDYYAVLEKKINYKQLCLGITYKNIYNLKGEEKHR